MTQAPRSGYRLVMSGLPTDPEQIVLLHNPRCSKSRATKEILEKKGVAFHERLYLEDPLDEGELAEVGRRLGAPLADWVRTKEKAYAEAGLSSASSAAELAAAVVAAPILMERPIVIRGERAAIGRPPEAVLDLLR